MDNRPNKHVIQAATRVIEVKAEEGSHPALLRDSQDVLPPKSDEDDKGIFFKLASEGEFVRTADLPNHVFTSSPGTRMLTLPHSTTAPVYRLATPAIPVDTRASEQSIMTQLRQTPDVSSSNPSSSHSIIHNLATTMSHPNRIVNSVRTPLSNSVGYSCFSDSRQPLSVSSPLATVAETDKASPRIVTAITTSQTIGVSSQISQQARVVPTVQTFTYSQPRVSKVNVMDLLKGNPAVDDTKLRAPAPQIHEVAKTSAFVSNFSRPEMVLTSPTTSPQAINSVVYSQQSGLPVRAIPISNAVGMRLGNPQSGPRLIRYTSPSRPPGTSYITRTQVIGGGGGHRYIVRTSSQDQVDQSPSNQGHLLAMLTKRGEDQDTTRIVIGRQPIVTGASAIVHGGSVVQGVDQKTDLPQNVLLKQLLQTTSTISSDPPPTTQLTSKASEIPMHTAKISQSVPTPQPAVPNRISTMTVARPTMRPSPHTLNVSVIKPYQDNTPQIKTEFPIKREESYESRLSFDSTDDPFDRVDDDDFQKDRLYNEEEMKRLQEDERKARRRISAQKRRQSQSREALGAAKKKMKKMSRMDEDYDSFVDSMMTQIRTLPPLHIMEPPLQTNFNLCPVIGSGDLAALNNKDFIAASGKLEGEMGNAKIPKKADFYDSQPYGDTVPRAPTPEPTQPPVRGYYSEEFAPPKIGGKDVDADGFIRDTDTPDTIVSSSSPECVMPDNLDRFPGLRLIEEDQDENTRGMSSPVIPIVEPIPIRIKPKPTAKGFSEENKENKGVNPLLSLSSKLGLSSATPLKDTANIGVTLTLTSEASEDILGVLKKLANVLDIAPPMEYQVIERTTTPPSQKLGLYKQSKDGKQIDIESVLKGPPTFCKHCDVVILSNIIRKTLQDFPFLSREDLEGDEVSFCSTNCYLQFALTRKSVSKEKEAGLIVDHLSNDIDSLNKKDNPHLKVSRKRKFNLLDDDASGQKNRKSPIRIWKYWEELVEPAKKFKKESENEITQMLYRMGITLTPQKIDNRRCMFCSQPGDGVADGPGRLLNFDVDKWVHINCALWAEEVYETTGGALMNVDQALKKTTNLVCPACERKGASVRCFKLRCTSAYHLGCALKDGWVFYKDKTAFCAQHVLRNMRDSELTTLAVLRRVYVNRDENRQVATVMHNGDGTSLMRSGGLILLNVGQLLPHQLENFHTHEYIYPIGYKVVKIYWSMRRPNKRCKYICSIDEAEGKPIFRVEVKEPSYEDTVFIDTSARKVWHRILVQIYKQRVDAGMVKMFPSFIIGEDLFGLTDNSVVKVLESLPGIESLSDYRFKYGRNPLLELPLVINPTGCARSEPKLRTHFKRRHAVRSTVSKSTCRAQNTSPSSFPVALSLIDQTPSYIKQFIFSKGTQYRKMKAEWRSNVYLARSKIQGLGLYAAKDLEKHTMVIEYIGEIIRPELAEVREKRYESQNRGTYMFRLDDNRVIDATMTGGMARYINHSCDPNCNAECVDIERDLHIVIMTLRRIQAGEELAYDYKFDFEDESNKIPCNCGAVNCKKWMN